MVAPEEAQAAGTRLSLQLSAVVRAFLSSFSRHVNLVVSRHPGMSAREIFAREDVRGLLDANLLAARRTAASLIRQAWGAGGGSSSSPWLEHLLEDADQAFAAFPGQAEGIVREAVLVKRDDTADRAAAAVRNGVDDLVHRVRLSLQVAPGFSHTGSVLEEGRRRTAAGERVMKTWKSRQDARTCRWCRLLHGVTIPLEDEFPHGEPVALPQQRTRHVATPAGAVRYHRAIGQPIILTFPPRVWLGQLLGPPRHPGPCRCWLELTPVTDEPPPAPLRGPEPGQVFLRASEVSAMPEEQYHGMLAFVRAAVHELGQLLRRLKGVSGG
jgi:hypothetical protein